MWDKEPRLLTDACALDSAHMPIPSPGAPAPALRSAPPHCSHRAAGSRHASALFSLYLTALCPIAVAPLWPTEDCYYIETGVGPTPGAAGVFFSTVVPWGPPWGCCYSSTVAPRPLARPPCMQLRSHVLVLWRTGVQAATAAGGESGRRQAAGGGRQRLLGWNVPEIGGCGLGSR